MRNLFLTIIILLISAYAAYAQDDVTLHCPTLTRLIESGQIAELSDPVFTDRKSAEEFAVTCTKVVRELDSAGILPQKYLQIRQDAALAAEFLTGDPYLLANNDVRSVVTLRKTVKIPPPPGFVYVKTYKTAKSMPPVVADVFQRLTPEEGAKVQGVTIRGRYIAILKSDYAEQNADSLAHEMVHAYITLVSPSELPKWFQEGSAVYFTGGSEYSYYIKNGDTRIAQVGIPEDYKRKLYAFQHLEHDLGKKKLYEFVRKSVVTGVVDARPALGIKPNKPQPKPPVWPIYAICGGAAALVAIAAIIQQRRDAWLD